MRYELTGVKGVLFGTLIPFAPFASFAQPSHVLLNDAQVVITEIEVSPAVSNGSIQAFIISKSQPNPCKAGGHRMVTGRVTSAHQWRRIMV
jgi:hypothetical protein